MSRLPRVSHVVLIVLSLCLASGCPDEPPTGPAPGESEETASGNTAEQGSEEAESEDLGGSPPPAAAAGVRRHRGGGILAGP